MNIRVFAICHALAAFAAGGERKISLYTAIDAGRLEKAYDMQKRFDPSGLALNRTYVDVGFMEQLDATHQINVGVGGIFWKANESNGGNPEDKVIKFGPAISNAYLKWKPLEGVDLNVGYFPYKYNAAAKNLGEYLFRTEAYPTIIYTGGWNWINSASYRTVGIMATWKTGALKQDIGLFGEYFNSPIYDITPAYIATWKPARGLTLGGAGSLHRFISPTPQVQKDLTRPYEYYENFYFPEVSSKRKYNVDIPGYIGTSSYNLEWLAQGSPNLDSLRNDIFARESAELQLAGIASAQAIPLSADTNSLSLRNGRPAEYASKLKADIVKQAQDDGSDDSAYFKDPHNAGAQAKTVSFDLAAVKLLAFFELDFNAMLGWDADRVGDFNLYGEVAQLGLKNYPIFYTSYAQRRPIMLGLGIPTGGLLKHLSFEVEYLKNPVIESIASTYDKLDLPPDEAYRYRAFAKDDWKWTLHATRQVWNTVFFHLQIANDHMRLKDGYSRPQYIPVTRSTGDWYWITRLQWGV